MSNYLSLLLNPLLVLAFILDRVFRLRSIKEYKDAREAQIAVLKQQLESEISNNDIRITAMHQKRYESLKILLDEKEIELDSNHEALLKLQTALQQNMEKGNLLDMLLTELGRVERSKLSTALKRKLFLQQVKTPINRY
jgi:hypothetical protein